ncbi:MAG TPA: hypothetical protein PLU72_02305 [Candidatus Ozemobacteraceae bacterium]|nr:hypothetical protein [Candidatus Ozemobacteraceae bacterium]HQG30141.1 hypothetical protein [Candidatus Ozemobacteraceae bacterium]
MNTVRPPFIMAPDGSLQCVDPSSDPHLRTRGTRPDARAGWVRAR